MAESIIHAAMAGDLTLLIGVLVIVVMLVGLANVVK